TPRSRVFFGQEHEDALAQNVRHGRRRGELTAQAGQVLEVLPHVLAVAALRQVLFHFVADVALQRAFPEVRQPLVQLVAAHAPAPRKWWARRARRRMPVRRRATRTVPGGTARVAAT